MAISSPLYVRQDEVVNLTCKAIAFPRPNFQWSINGTVRAGRGQAGMCEGLPRH